MLPSVSGLVWIFSHDQKKIKAANTMVCIQLTLVLSLVSVPNAYFTIKTPLESQDFLMRRKFLNLSHTN